MLPQEKTLRRLVKKKQRNRKLTRHERQIARKAFNEWKGLLKKLKRAIR